MKQFEVTFSVYKSNEPGRASIRSSLFSSLKAIISAGNESQARSMIQAQYGSTCRIYGVRPV